jgi:hypothetical protein
MVEEALSLIAESVNGGGGDLEITPAKTLVGEIPLPNGESATIQLIAQPVDLIEHFVQRHEASGEEIPQWLQDAIIFMCEHEGREIPSACTHSNPDRD